MDSLVARCVDAIAHSVAGIGRESALDGATEEMAPTAQIAMLLERLEMLPYPVCQCFAQRIQHHVGQLRRSGHVTEQSTEAERALWMALVDRQWLTHLRAAALPGWLQLSPTDMDWTVLTTLDGLDLSRLTAPNADGLAAFFLQSLPLHALRSLNLCGLETIVTDALIYTLATSCRRLEHLDVSYCPHVSDVASSALVACHHKTLRSLRFNGMRQLVGTDALIDAIEKCSLLDTLGLEGCVGFSRLPSIGSALPNVTTLEFHGLIHVPDDGMLSALSGCFNRLQRLKLGESELSGDSLMRLAQSSPSPVALVALDLSWSQRVTNDAIIELIRRSPSLTALTLRCTAINDAVLAAIGETLTRLRELDLERCDDLSSDGFELFASHPTCGLCYLEKLNLSWTNVGSAAMINILSKCSQMIRKVRLQGCKCVDRTLLEAMGCGSANIARPCPRLELVDFAWTNGASDEQIELLAAQTPHVRWIGYYGTEIG